MSTTFVKRKRSTRECRAVLVSKEEGFLCLALRNDPRWLLLFITGLADSRHGKGVSMTRHHTTVEASLGEKTPRGMLVPNSFEDLR